MREGVLIAVMKENWRGLERFLKWNNFTSKIENKNNYVSIRSILEEIIWLA